METPSIMSTATADTAPPSLADVLQMWRAYFYRCPDMYRGFWADMLPPPPTVLAIRGGAVFLEDE